MTGLTETEHVVAAFEAGGADYVTKPIRPQEVLARIAAHMASARLMKQARTALDAFGQATLAIRPESGQVVRRRRWPCKLMKDYFSGHEDEAPPAVMAWVQESTRARRKGGFPAPAYQPGGQAADLHLHERAGEDECLLVLREESEPHRGGCPPFA
ncbi:MAG: hypothetical protein IPJ73_11850 [Zoogloea sp.]|nr:hypothetical protein [Zoogloea sp.]